MTCDAGMHWSCPGRNTVTVSCRCLCHRLTVIEAMRFEGVKGQFVRWVVS